MLVKVINECGYEEALLGLSLSFYDHKIPLLDWDVPANSLEHTILERGRGKADIEDKTTFWTDEKFTKAQKIAILLAHRTANSNIARDNPDYIRAEKKFLRSICVWIYIQAPRSWWSEYDTYTVGMTKNSSSTMHTVNKRPTESLDYELGTSVKAIENFNECIILYNKKLISLAELKNNLPEGYLQERQICTNYATLQNILNQREGHRLSFWKQHREEILAQIQHPELLVQI